MSHGNGIDGRSGGRFGAATPGVRSERAPIGDLVAIRGPGRTASRRRVITPWRMAALMVAIIVAGGTYALGRYVIAPKAAQEMSLAVTKKALPEGQRLTSGYYRVMTVPLSSAPRGALSPSEVAKLKGRFAKFSIPAGTFLKSGMLSAAGGMPDATHALVGLALKPGQMPAGGLTVGQKVDILLLPVNADGSVADLTSKSDATIWEMRPPDSSGARVVTVLVHRDLASRLANYAAHGQVSLVLTEASQQG
jgi:hypothetical protein